MRLDLIPIGTLRRSGKKLDRIVFIVAHDTGNLNSTAKNNVDYYKRTANEMSASAHLFVDDKETVLCVPIEEKAWHVRYDLPVDNQMFGDDANDISIGIELCYFDDLERSKKAYANYVKEFVKLCAAYSLDPRKHIVGHYLLDPARRTDPVNAFKRIGKTMNGFIDDVAESLKPPISKHKAEGMEAVDKLHKLGRISNPTLWKENIMKVPNLEYIFIGWAKEV
jgi:N-acetylmuramoyl-L-alanine amidase CwlA